MYGGNKKIIRNDVMKIEKVRQMYGLRIQRGFFANHWVGCLQLKIELLCCLIDIDLLQAIICGQSQKKIVNKTSTANQKHCFNIFHLTAKLENDHENKSAAVAATATPTIKWILPIYLS